MPLIIIDGLDGIGKGVIIDTIKNYEIENGKKVFDLEQYWKEKHTHPEYEEIKDYDTIISAEPTRALLGNLIRHELVANNSRKYSAKTIATAFSIDREALYKRILIPALKDNKTIIQSRSLITSIVYQPLQDKHITKEFILSLEGNQFVMQYPPSLLIIPTIKNPEELIKRLNQREKKDNAIFENLDFQMKAKPYFESDWLRNLFESKGTIIKYLDAGISVESTKQQALEIYKNFQQKTL